MSQSTRFIVVDFHFGQEMKVEDGCEKKKQYGMDLNFRVGQNNQYGYKFQDLKKKS